MPISLTTIGIVVAIVTLVWWFVFGPKRTGPRLPHDEKVRIIQESIRRWNQLPAAERRPLCIRRSSNLAITSRATSHYKASAHQLDFDQFDEVIGFNADAKTVICEPQVDMGKVSAYLIPRGFTLPVVPEIKGLTVGGLLLGAGVESSSHKYGLVKDSVIAYEIVLGDGEVKRVTKTNDPELFAAIPFSYGSFCFLLSAEFQIIPAKPYVRVNYEQVRSQREALQKIGEYSFGRPVPIIDHSCEKLPEKTEDRKVPIPDFVEAVMYTREDGIVGTANMVDADVVHADSGKFYGLPYYDFYYRHMKAKFFNKPPGGYEYMRLFDYLFRHDRGVFWSVEMKFSMASKWWVRMLMGCVLDRRLRLCRRKRGVEEEAASEQRRVLQDAIVPLEHTLESMRLFDDIFGILPVWLCPMRIYHPATELHAPPHLLNFVPQYKIYLDVGLYGKPTAPGYVALDAHRKMEAFLRRVNGFVASYAVSYSTRSEFWEMNNRELYEKIRKRTNAQGAFVDIYDKIGGGPKVLPFEREEKKSQ